MENKDDRERQPRTEVFVTSWGQEVTMTYNPALDNLPKPQLLSDKYSPENRRRRNLKPPIDLAKYIRSQVDSQGD